MAVEVNVHPTPPPPTVIDVQLLQTNAPDGEVSDTQTVYVPGAAYVWVVKEPLPLVPSPYVQRILLNVLVGLVWK